MEGFAGKVAAVTGAGSGIGQALALELGRSGASLAISDVDTEGLATTEAQLKAIGAPVRSDRLDVTEREAFQIYAEDIREHFGKVNQIYNNAGIAYIGDVDITHFKDIERVMDVDFWGVVNGTKAFLPHLVASGDGHVVNVSSLFGLMAMPGQAAYNAAKFAVRGFTEALRQEMVLNREPVKVTSVHPGGIKTAIARNGLTAEGINAQAQASFFDKTIGQHHAAASGRDHLGRRAQEQGPGAGRPGRRRAGPDRADHRFALPAAVRPRLEPNEAAVALTRRHEPASRRLPPSAAERVFVQPGVGHRLRIGPGGHLAAHVDQRGGVQHAGHLVDRQQLPVGQLVAAIQRHHILGLHQRRLAVGQHHQVGGHVRVGGAGPCRRHLTRAHGREKCCIVREFATGG